MFDFEPVAAQEHSARAFRLHGLRASTTRCTLRANREGFLKFQLRPRRLVDVSKVDMCDRHPRREILLARSFLSPSGGHKGYHPDGEIGVAKRGEERRSSDDPFDPGDRPRSKDVIGRARPADLVRSSTPPTSSRSPSSHVQRAEKAGALRRRRGDGRPQRRPAMQEQAAPDATDSTPATARSCHDNSSLAAAQRDKPMYDGVDL